MENLARFRYFFTRFDDRLLGPARCLADAKRLVNLSLCRLGDRGFTDMQRALISAAEGRGNALLPIQDAAQQGPAFTLPVLPQSASYDLHELVGKHGDKQMTFGAQGFVMIDRRSPSSDFRERNTASRSVSVMYVRHRVSSSQSVWLLRRQYTPGCVSMEPLTGCRRQLMASA